MATHSVFLFRHIQTNQVIVSTRQFAKNNALRQLDYAVRPVRLRKDLWRPMVALIGFKTVQSAQAVSDALLLRSKARRLELQTSAEHLSKPKRVRRELEKDMLEQSIISLREAVEAVAPKYFKDDADKLSALWEQARFMDLGGKEWPAFVEHGLLTLKNNRLVPADSS